MKWIGSTTGVQILIVILNFEPLFSHQWSAFCPDKCTCTKDLNCARAGLTKLSSRIDPDIISLDLSDNFFTKIPERLANFHYLETLRISNNNLTEINVPVLSSMTSLKSLDLSGNGLAKSKKQLEQLISKTSLEYLNLGGNNLSFLFTEMDNVRLKSDTLLNLELQNSSIGEMKNKWALLKLNKLQSLDLSSNPIIWLNQISSESLQILDLTNCQLNHIRSNAFLSVPSLKVLFLSNNPQLRLYPNSHPASKSLQILHLENCNLETNFLKEFPNLTDVYLSGNVIRTIQANSFENNPILEFIDLSRSNINSINRLAFANLSRLRHLDLSENRLTSLPSDVFITNDWLTAVNLSRNRIKIIDVIESRSLLVMDLSYSEVQVISHRFLRYLPSLRDLVLSHNPIEQLPVMFESNSLEVLDLSYCRLLIIGDDSFQDLFKLRHINLEGNRLSDALKRQMFPKSISLISLNNNPWVCDCPSLKPFYDYLKQPPEKVVDSKQLTCHTPKNVSGKSWFQACRKTWFVVRPEMAPSLERTWLFVVVTFLTLVILFCVVSTARRVVNQQQEREQEEMERMAEEARARVRLMRQRQRESALLNAPDPRDLISPPSYEEALKMLRPSNSDLRLKRASSSSAPNETIEIQQLDSDS